NPEVRVNNNQGIEAGLGAGDQEVCPNYETITEEVNREQARQYCIAQLLEKRVNAAVYLYGLTGDSAYKSIVEGGINENRLYWVSDWNENRVRTFFSYVSLPGGTPAVASDIRGEYASAINTPDVLGGYRNNSGAHLAHMAAVDFTWGSNRSISQRGTLFHKLIDLPGQDGNEARNAALSYLHYLH